MKEIRKFALSQFKPVSVAIIWSFGFLVIGFNVILSAHYQDRIYPGVKIGSMMVGGLTKAEAASRIALQTSAYRLQLKIDDKSYSIEPTQFGASYEPSISAQTAFAQGRDQWLPMMGVWDAIHKQPLIYSYSIDKAKLTEYVSKLTFQQAQAPSDAVVTVVKGAPIVTPDKSGLAIDKDSVSKLIVQAIDTQNFEVKTSRSLVAADVRADTARAAAEAAKRVMGTKIELAYQDKRFAPSTAQIGEWIIFKKEAGRLVPEIDPGKLKAYIGSNVSSSVNVAPTNKQINVLNGQVKSEEGGVDGLAVNEADLAAKMNAALIASTALSVEVPTAKVVFKTVYNRTISLDTGRYIEINLATQRLWAYQDYQLVHEAPITSGATGAGYPTVQGLFSIYSKEPNRYLNGFALGYNYNVFVKYWMPFTGNYGLHDASWRSSFGGGDYYYNGSHGCVNLPEATAAWLFGWAEIGTPVWVHS